MGLKFRRSKSGRAKCKRPDFAEYWRKKWAEPGYREQRLANSKKYTRYGVPPGETKKTMKPLWDLASKEADEWIMKLEKEGVVKPDAVIVPDSDDAIAKATLREAALIALGPVGDKRLKLAAINTCLNFTKQRPISKAEVAVKSPEDWLSEALEASKRPNGETL